MQNRYSILRMFATWMFVQGLLSPMARGAFRELFFHSDGCSLDSLSCWSTDGRMVSPPATLPDGQTTSFFLGVSGEQPPGASHVWRGMYIEPLEFANVYLPSQFTQNGNLTLEFVRISDASTHLLVQGNLNAQDIVMGDPSYSIRLQPEPALFEQQGGVATVSGLTIGNSFSPPAGGGTIHYPATLWLKGGRFNATGVNTGLQAGSLVDAIIKLDGGFLNATTVTGMSEVTIGSAAPFRGTLDRSNGQTLSCTQLSAGLQGGRGTVLVAGTGAHVTASDVLFAAGADSIATVAIGLNGEGQLDAGSLRMAVDTNSTATLQVQGALARVEVGGSMDVGLGGTAQVTVQNGGQLITDRLNLGASLPGAPVAKLILAEAGTTVEANILTVGAGSGGELSLYAGATCSTAQLKVGPGGLLQLKRGFADAGQAEFLADSSLHIDIAGPAAGTDYSQLLDLATLDFDGNLVLNFVDGFTPGPGQSFQLFSFTSFTGNFDPASITVNGFNKNDLDFSRLSVDGTLWVGPAPGPFKLTLTAGAASSYDLAWGSNPGKLYDLITSTNLFLPFPEWTVHETHRNIRATLTSSALAGLPASDLPRYFAMIEKEMPVPVIPNPSFEADAFTVWPGYLSNNGGTISGWNHTGLAAGLNPSSGIPFADNGAVPDGVNVAFLQSNGNAEQLLSTTITGLVPGVVYTVSFRANARAATAAPSPSWSLNGAAFAPFTASPSVGAANPYYLVTGSFTATAETAGLTIRNQTAIDTAVLVDDFSIHPE